MEYGVTRAESDEDSKNKIIHTSEQTYFQICFIASRLLDSCFCASLTQMYLLPNSI